MSRVNDVPSEGCGIRVYRALEVILRWMSIICMFVLVVLVCGLVLVRFFPVVSM